MKRKLTDDNLNVYLPVTNSKETSIEINNEEPGEDSESEDEFISHDESSDEAEEEPVVRQIKVLPGRPRKIKRTVEVTNNVDAEIHPEPTTVDDLIDHPDREL